jgi:hypothetical protein
MKSMKTEEAAPATIEGSEAARIQYVEIICVYLSPEMYVDITVT